MKPPTGINTKPHPKQARLAARTRGFALVAVLWVSSLLALLAAGVGSGSRTDLRITYNMAKQAKARALADAGFHQALFQILTRPRSDQTWQDGALGGQIALEGGEVRFQITDEDGKLDLNAAPIELLRGLFEAVGLDEDQARTLADRVGDFRDPDSDPLPLGAEDAAYLAAGRVNGATDRPFLSTRELLDVMGMTDQAFRRIERHVTIYADVEGLDPSRAAPTALLALPGVTPALAATLAAPSGDDDPLSSVPAEIADEIEPYLLPSRDLIFSIESLGSSKEGGRFLREAVIALDGGTRDLPFTVYAWRRDHLTSLGSVLGPRS